MAQAANENWTSLRATVSIGAYRVVAHAATTGTEVLLVNTVTTIPFGICQDNVSTGDAAPIALLGSRAKAICGASVSAGAVLGADTAGAVIEVTGGNEYQSLTGTAIARRVGLSLMAGSTNAVIDILVAPEFIRFL